LANRRSACEFFHALFIVNAYHYNGPARKVYQP